MSDLPIRLRSAGVSEEQADAISGAFDALSSQMAIIMAAVLGPYIARLFA